MSIHHLSLIRFNKIMFPMLRKYATKIQSKLMCEMTLRTFIKISRNIH